MGFTDPGYFSQNADCVAVPTRNVKSCGAMTLMCENRKSPEHGEGIQYVKNHLEIAKEKDRFNPMNKARSGRRVAMNKQKWHPKLPKNSRLILGDRGYYARIGGKQRWVCSKTYSVKEAEKRYHRMSAAKADDSEPLPEIVPAECATLGDILNRWAIARREDADMGSITPGAWSQYRLSAKRISDIAGHYFTDDILPDHVKAIYTQLARKHGANFAKTALSHLRTCCRHAEEYQWCRPIRLGAASIEKLIRRPQKKMRWVLLTPNQVQAIALRFGDLIADADGRSLPTLIQLRAMFLLALNGGYGATELSTLRKDVLDLPGWRIDYARGKTGMDHVVPLWIPTVLALRDVLALELPGDLLFRTREGNPWAEAKGIRSGGVLKRTIRTDNVNERWKEVITPMGLRVKGQGFYKLKHLHCTLADEAGDPHATFALAGHGLPGAKRYYVSVSEDRIRNVVNHVHRCLFTKSTR